MIKRLIDIVASIIGLIILAPFFLLISLLIKLDSKGEIFFRQERVGKGCSGFRIFKFRTMTKADPTKELQITVGEDARITKIGKFLRKYRIDELPQLINVLLGQMSLVGPRPEVPKYMDCYSKRNKDIVLSVRPGITDLASVKFKDESEILANADDPRQTYIKEILPKKIALYRYYVRNKSLCLDIAIILKTIRAVI